VVELIERPAKGDPEVSLPEHGDREAAFSLLRSVVVDLAGSDGSVALSGLKNQLRKVRPEFSEKKLVYGSFLQFCKAAATAGNGRSTVEVRRRRLPAHRQDPNLTADVTSADVRGTVSCRCRESGW
jgi:hypothetical protein